MARLFQGIARLLSGNPARAIEVLEPLCESAPRAPLPHLELGLALRETVEDSQGPGLRLEVGDTVTIKSGLFGSHKLYGSGNRSSRVDRVR